MFCHEIISNKSTHYLFQRAEEDHGPEVDVYLKSDTLRFGVSKKLDTYATFQVVQVQFMLVIYNIELTIYNVSCLYQVLKNDLGTPQLNRFTFW